MRYDEINEATITDLVHSFYAKVRKDPLIGPIFNDKIQDNWEPHLETMVRFWSSVMLTTGAYKGNPMAKHQQLPGLRAEHFARWLDIFEETACALFVASHASDFIFKAHRIADSLQAHSLMDQALKKKVA